MSSAYRNAKQYEQSQHERNYNSEISFIQEKIQNQYGKQKLDILIIGCGPGEHSKRFNKQGHTVTSIDPELNMIELAQTKSDSTFLQASLPDLPVRGMFDVVILPFGVINHLSSDELESSIREVYETLSEDGILLFDKKNPDIIEKYTKIMSEISGESDFKINRHDSQKIEKCLETHGFDFDKNHSNVGMGKNNTTYTAYK